MMKISFSKSPPNYSKYLDKITALETEIGTLSIPWNIDEIDHRHKQNFQDYLVKKLISSYTRLMQYGAGIKADIPVAVKGDLVSSNHIQYPPISQKTPVGESDSNINKVMQDLLNNFTLTNWEEFAISQYISSYEYILNNFILPIFDNLQAQYIIPDNAKKEWKKWKGSRRIYYWPSHLKILAVTDFFSHNEDYRDLIVLIEDLETDLRNGLAHENMYISDDIIHYFQKIKSKLIWKEMEVQRFAIKSFYQLYHKIFIMQMITMRTNIESDFLNKLFHEVED
ncbi:MAG: hypothetical protein GPJ54_20210 [Candidatus Heimdallarchaeota archaeon]|nr:hypothetical protein [Candidatus Heimdallarchaeota archaeon]